MTMEGLSVPRTIAFLNKKGGVGKTSTVHHLAGTLARRGLRCLLVDADPQASLTQGLLGPEVAEELDPRETIAAIFDESGAIPARSLVRPTAFNGLSLLPGSEAAEQYNDPNPWESGMRQFVLRDAIAETSDGFRTGPDRLPTPYPALGLVGAGRGTGRGRPASGRGLWRKG